MRVLVTGAAGFIGSHTTRCLLDAGDDVVAIAKPGEDAARLASVRDRIRLHEVDLADAAGVARLVEEVRPNAAIHLAWYAVPGKYWNAIENLSCVQESLGLFQRLIENGCKRILGIGTCAEYDWRFDLLDEKTTPCVSATLYGSAKHALYLMAGSLCRLRDVSFAWARYGFTYGPGEADGRLVSNVAATLLRGSDVECSSGQQRRDFCYVEDLADATAALARSDVVGPVNVGSGEVVSVREVVEQLAEIVGGTGKPLFGALSSAPEDPPLLRLNTTRLFEEVGWRPRHPLAEGLNKTVAWHREKSQRRDGGRS